MIQKIVFMKFLECSLRYLMMSVLLGLLVTGSGCSTLTDNPSKEFVSPLTMNDNQKSGMRKFYAAREYQYSAFAISRSGHWGYASSTNGSNAEVVALSVCQAYATGPCRIQISNGTLDPKNYGAFAISSAEASAKLSVPSERNYHDELTDWNVPFRSDLLFGPAINSPTPIMLPGVKTISTSELVSLLKTTSLPLIDAMGWSEEKYPALPNSYLIDHIGWPPMGQEADLQKVLSKIMVAIQPDKTGPVVVYCESSKCWLSVNAVHRLKALGFTNILWYRGGIFSWIDAGLPVVNSLPYATVLSYKPDN